MNTEDERSSAAVGQTRQRIGYLVPAGIRDPIPGKEDLLVLQAAIFSEPDASDELRVGHHQ